MARQAIWEQTMGAIRLMKRVAMTCLSVSRLKRSSGKIGVSDSKDGRRLAASGSL